jgi:hypothetical protein
VGIRGSLQPISKYFGTCFKIQIWIELSRKNEFYEFISKQRIISLRHNSILWRIWLNFMHGCQAVLQECVLYWWLVPVQCLWVLVWCWWYCLLLSRIVTYDGYFKIHSFGIDFIRHITIKICTSLPFPSLKSWKYNCPGLVLVTG